jgi:hypothetical protein
MLLILDVDGWMVAMFGSPTLAPKAAKSQNARTQAYRQRCQDHLISAADQQLVGKHPAQSCQCATGGGLAEIESARGCEDLRSVSKASSTRSKFRSNVRKFTKSMTISNVCI